jgi:hypothetical protein
MAKLYCTNNALWRGLFATSCILSIVAFTLPTWANGESASPPPEARVMTAAELFVLYRNKSWQWRDGVGRMQSDGRRFTAWAGSEDTSTWAEGKWIVTNGGRLCFKAQWHSSSGSHPDKTCFRHKRYRDTIYQKREPSQAWYVFKHAPTAENDEFHKLVSQDLVSSELERVRSTLKPAAYLPDNK